MERRPAIRKVLLASLGLVVLWIANAAFLQADSSSCPPDALAVQAGASLQMAVDRAGDGATFCLKNGIHRGEAVRPRDRQRFYGEGHAILNGSRVVTDFHYEGPYWITQNHFMRGPMHGECLFTASACNQPGALFIDDRPLKRVATRQEVVPGAFYVDYDGDRIYLLDDPTHRKVEATTASFAFESSASGVEIRNVVVEKFASLAQKGAIHAREGAGWIIEDCEVRLNSGAGISVGSGTRVRNCDVHHNGQIGIEGNGKDIRIENNRIRSNNIRGFDPAWEAGGVKIAECDGVVFNQNHVSDNDGPGLWCDIDCRNVSYERNVVEDNRHSGILHEISFKALIRDNVVRRNGRGERSWFWGADVTIAASEGVTVTGNKITVEPGGCGIMLIDQGRRAENGALYKTQNNKVIGNDLTFEGAACAGGTSDTTPDHPNFGIITRGNNRFDENIYRVPRTQAQPRFVWGRELTDWNGFRSLGVEAQGQLIAY